MNGAFEVRPAGECGLHLVFGETIGAGTADALRSVAERIRSAGLPGVLDIVPGYVSLFIAFDPLRWTHDELKGTIASLPKTQKASGERRLVRLPVCYGGEFGPDLWDVAESGGMSQEEAVSLHAEREYDVYFLGFTPGFAFMGEVDERIALGRLPSPRTAVPSGSVGIAGRQTGVYPVESPGGWRIVGRTPVRMYRPGDPDPILLRPGDRVRFAPISAEEFQEIAASGGGAFR